MPSRTASVAGEFLVTPIYIEKINAPFPFGDKTTPAEYRAWLKLAIDWDWVDLHESGTYVKLTQSGADLFGLFRQRIQ